MPGPGSMQLHLGFGATRDHPRQRVEHHFREVVEGQLVHRCTAKHTSSLQRHLRSSSCRRSSPSIMLVFAQRHQQWTGIAVGMPITGRPQHSSGRAQFTHPALTSGSQRGTACMQACVTYTVQALGPPFPALSPARVGLVGVPLGPGPWLHPLRSRWRGFVRRLHSYYGRV